VLCGVLARTSAVAAGSGPARQIGTAAANEVARAHEVSIQMAAGLAGLCRAGLPGLNTSTMRMAEPQHGQGLRGVGGSAGQHVDQEPADELVRVERHRLVASGSVDPAMLSAVLYLRPGPGAASISRATCSRASTRGSFRG
jgi:hypothetical protein